MNVVHLQWFTVHGGGEAYLEYRPSVPKHIEVEGGSLTKDGVSLLQEKVQQVFIVNYSVILVQTTAAMTEG